MRVLIIGLAAVALAGCQSTKRVSEMSYSEINQLADQIIQRCLDQGVKKNTPEMNTCTRIEANREIASRDNARVRQARAMSAIGDSLQGVSDGYYRAAAQPNNSVSCNTRPLGAGQYATNCY